MKPSNKIGPYEGRMGLSGHRPQDLAPGMARPDAKECSHPYACFLCGKGTTGLVEYQICYFDQMAFRPADIDLIRSCLRYPPEREPKLVPIDGACALGLTTVVKEFPVPISAGHRRLYALLMLLQAAGLPLRISREAIFGEPEASLLWPGAVREIGKPRGLLSSLFCGEEYNYLRGQPIVDAFAKQPYETDFDPMTLPIE